MLTVKWNLKLDSNTLKQTKLSLKSYGNFILPKITFNLCILSELMFFSINTMVVKTICSYFVIKKHFQTEIETINSLICICSLL